MSHVCFCGVLARHLDVPAVARALDRLRDEVTVAACVATGLGELPEHRVRGPDRKRMIRALGFGPLFLRELIAEVYPLPTPDAEEVALRAQRVKCIAHRLVALGVLVRPARGLYALAAFGPRPDPVASMDDCRRVLADPHVNPPGLTAREIAERLDIPLPTIQKWLERLRDRGAGIVVTPEANPAGGPRRHRYRIEQAAREVA